MGGKTRGQGADGEGRRAAGARLPRRGPGPGAARAPRPTRIGFPVLIKAVAGGGGKGMRVVDAAPTSSPPRSTAPSARRRAAFGDDRVLIEQLPDRGRATSRSRSSPTRHGNCVHLFERDCSVQRRHQKVLEEAPAPGPRPAAPARAHGRGRGRGGQGGRLRRRRHGRVHRRRRTARFYFMEMNTRLQVEHPVTEMITGLDLVEWQLRVAAGEPLPLHAGRARDPRPRDRGAPLRRGPGSRTSCPRPAGSIHLALPAGERPSSASTPACGEGDAITLFYDPMIAKLIVWGRRPRAARWRRLRAALAEYRDRRPGDQRRASSRVAAHPAFAAADLDTGFIERHRADLLPAPRSRRRRRAGARARSAPARARRASARQRGRLRRPAQPLGRHRRLAPGRRRPRTPPAPRRRRSARWSVDYRARRLPAGRFADGRAAAQPRGQLGGGRHARGRPRRRAPAAACGPDAATSITVFHEAGGHRADPRSNRWPARRCRGSGGRLTAPMPGKVVARAGRAGRRRSSRASR